jgi:hypothetical protein
MHRLEILALLLAYYWTGLEKVFIDSLSSTSDQARQTRISAFRRLASGVFWPYVCLRKKELLWCASYFLGSSLAIAITLKLLVGHLGYFLTILIIGVIRTLPIPIISSAYHTMVGFVQMPILISTAFMLGRMQPSRAHVLEALRQKSTPELLEMRQTAGTRESGAPIDAIFQVLRERKASPPGR